MCVCVHIALFGLYECSSCNDPYLKRYADGKYYINLLIFGTLLKLNNILL